MSQEDENPYESPLIEAEIVDSPLAGGSAPAIGIWRKNDQLVMHKSARLPDICVKTNRPSQRRVRKKLAWHHPACIVLILAGVLPYALVAFLITKWVTIDIPVTNDWMDIRRKQITIALRIAALGALMFVAGVVVAAYEVLPEDTGYLLFLGSAFMGFGGLIASVMGARIVWPAKITERHVYLSGVNRELLARFPVWRGD